ncbi:MAG: flagellar assembly protein FliW [Chlamydiia bacterium]|nr:flagellar assembly protein FliW [Chlamydiia bacterium]
MGSQPSNVAEAPKTHHSKTIHFPDGLPAFEDVRDFVLIAKEEETPFMWLQAVNVPNLAFIVADPFVLCPGYQPDIMDEDCTSLGIQSPEDAYILAIVNIRNNEEHGVTANLVGPLVVNWREKRAKQVIIRNHLKYSVKHRVEG